MYHNIIHACAVDINSGDIYDIITIVIIYTTRDDDVESYRRKLFSVLPSDGV